MFSSPSASFGREDMTERSSLRPTSSMPKCHARVESAFISSPERSSYQPFISSVGIKPLVGSQQHTIDSNAAMVASRVKNKEGPKILPVSTAVLAIFLDAEDIFSG
ncbi:hypothetical protein I7I53_09551 [Histoplasma capsulatum var. duboisii H88]|uniref:Uncharacterized protein n=1 Tax=Ajellomyces capsulatus (strain H88) TaxID=544711 RepID=A0A8A1L5L5_AJEC8|nr:hypothetical protein I7I53_09551 [Histoplasma capsulatum var. duboisii H88]